MSGKQSFSNIGLFGNGVGSLVFKENSIEWRDRSNAAVKEIPKVSIRKASWTAFGTKSNLNITVDGDEIIKFDGFIKSEVDTVSSIFSSMFGVTTTAEKVSSKGANFGEIALENSKYIVLRSPTDGHRIFDVKLDRMSLCVIPASNRDECEIHLHESERVDREEDALAQITLHFPAGEDPEEDTPAEEFRRSVMDTGTIRTVTGDIIVEFTKEQGNFVSPRGKYAVQMMSTYMHMQGPQYSYKIKYEDIHSLFLLPKPDGSRNAFVISLDKPIRQGNQKYQHLIWEAHKIETTIAVNLTAEEIQEKYEGALTPSMTLPLSSLIAKIFKVLTQTVVFVPKQFESSRQQNSIRCSLRANEGLLYPLAKSFIFINKPTIVIKFEDIESVEFLRYDPASNAATRNFDIQVSLKAEAKSEAKEYTFSSIDRGEYSSLFDFFTARRLNVIIPEAAKRASAFAEADDGSEESDDESYEGGSQHSDDDDDSGSDSGSDKGSGDDSGSDSGSAGSGPKAAVEKSSSKKRSKPEPSSKKATAGKDDKKKRAKKDKDAPKGALSAYLYYCNSERDKVRAEQPSLSMIEISKELGARWKLLTSEDKIPFEAQAKQDKERFATENAAYLLQKKANAV